MNHGSHRGVIGIGRHENITAFDAQSAEDDFERRGAAVYRYGVLGADILSQARFELLTVGAKRQTPAGKNLLDAVGDPLAVLGGEVDACRRHHANWRTVHIDHRGLLVPPHSLRFSLASA